MARNFNALFELRDGKLFWKIAPKHHAELAGCEAGYQGHGFRGKHYWLITVDRQRIQRSRIVFHMVHGRWPEPCVDHINGNSLDDRPENLREATHAQNAQNAHRRPSASGLPRGVFANGRRFTARIYFNNVCEYLGTFDTPQEASSAYKKRQAEAFGEFAPPARPASLAA